MSAPVLVVSVIVSMLIIAAVAVLIAERRDRAHQPREQ